MADRLTETCFHCVGARPTAITPCPVGSGAAHHCLTAQGWFRSKKNWSCSECAKGYWKAPHPDWLATSCLHHDELRRRLDKQADEQRAAEEQADPPAPPAAARVTVINDILAEFDVMSARLGELTRMLREELIRQQREGNDPAQMQADTRGGRRTH